MVSLSRLNLNIDERFADKFTRERDCTYLHALLCDAMNAFILEKRGEGLSDEEIVLPEYLGGPLYKVSNFLGIKYGMCGEYYANWKMKDPYQEVPEDLHVTMLDRLYFFSQPEDQVDESLFFGGSMTGSFHLFNSIKLLHKLMVSIEREPHKSE